MKTRTSSPRRWTCTRTPSSLYSTAAGLMRSSADVEVVARRGEHRLHGTQQLERDRARGRPPVGQRDRRHRAEVAAQHQRPPHVGPRHLGGLRHGVGHHAGQRALRRGRRAAARPGSAARPRWRGRAGRGTASRRVACEPGPASTPMRVNALSTSAEVERGLGGRRRQVAQRGPADADLPLGQLTRQPGDGGRRLGRRDAAQQARRARCDLAAARRGRAHGGRGLDELAEQHAVDGVTGAAGGPPCRPPR